jgi:hypothetical protein
VLPDLAPFATICDNECDNGWTVFWLKVPSPTARPRAT